MPTGLSLKAYAVGSIVVAAGVILNTWFQYQQAYPMLVALANSKPSLVVIGNLILVIGAAIGFGIKAFFLGPLRDNETEYFSEKLYPTVLDLLLTVTLFRTSMSMSFMAMLFLLLCCKSFHWLIQKRVDFIGQTPLTHLSVYVRLVSLMILLLFLDVVVVIRSSRGVLTAVLSHLLPHLSPDSNSSINPAEGPSIDILYSFEFSVLSVILVGMMVKFGLSMWDLKVHQGRWDDKSSYIMYLEFAIDVMQFFIYTTFFFTLMTHYGPPIPLFRPLLVSFSNFRKRVADLLRYRQATQNMDQRFPDATPQELEASHNICIICREEMNQGKKLPCGHVLHMRCLREWLEHQQTCPTCRVSVLRPANNANNNNANIDNNINPNPNINNNNNDMQNNPLHPNLPQQQQQPYAPINFVPPYTYFNPDQLVNYYQQFHALQVQLQPQFQQQNPAAPDSEQETPNQPTSSASTVLNGPIPVLDNPTNTLTTSVINTLNNTQVDLPTSNASNTEQPVPSSSSQSDIPSSSLLIQNSSTLAPSVEISDLLSLSRSITETLSTAQVQLEALNTFISRLQQQQQQPHHSSTL